MTPQRRVEILEAAAENILAHPETFVGHPFSQDVTAEVWGLDSLLLPKLGDAPIGDETSPRTLVNCTPRAAAYAARLRARQIRRHYGLEER